MKTKNKIFVMVGIAVVLCSVFLVAIPAIATDQTSQEASANTITTSSEDDYVLGVYGNANEDDTIDMRDLTYVKLIFFGKKPETELADAKYDGKINPLDFIQIKLIIVGKEKEITVVDSADRVVTVKKPVKRIAIHGPSIVETFRSLGLEKDRIVGVSDWIIEDKVFFPEFSDSPSTGKYPADVEKILELRPEAVFLYTWPVMDDIQDKIESADPSIAVIRFDCYMLENFIDEAEKLGYILDKKEETGEFLEFYEGFMNTIKEKVEDIPENKRTRAYFETSKRYQTGGKGTGYHEELVMAGVNNVFSDISGYFDVDPEEVINRDPEIMLKFTHIRGYTIDDPTGLKEIWNEIINRPELASVSAVKNKKVYVLSWSIGSSIRCFIGSGYTAKWSYPDLFKDFDPQAIHQEYLTKFQGLDIDVSQHGVFVYHSEQHPDGR